MKYVAKFVNGYWCSFDTEAYENTQVFYLRKNAMEAVMGASELVIISW